MLSVGDKVVCTCKVGSQKEPQKNEGYICSRTGNSFIVEIGEQFVIAKPKYIYKLVEMANEPTSLQEYSKSHATQLANCIKDFNKRDSGGLTSFEVTPKISEKNGKYSIALDYGISLSPVKVRVLEDHQIIERPGWGIFEWHDGDPVLVATYANEIAKIAKEVLKRIYAYRIDSLGDYVSDETEIQVEYFRCWPSGTWDTDFINIPSNTPSDSLDKAVREAADKLDWGSTPPAFVGYYSSYNPNDT